MALSFSFLLDVEGRVAAWSAGAERATGWRADEIVGRPLAALFGREGELTKKDGSRVAVEVTRTAMHDAAGRVSCYTADASSEPRDQEDVDNLNRQLELRVAELADANQELEAFSYSVSHDLRGPLRAIDGFSKILIEEYRSQLDEQGRHYLDRVRAGGQRMGHLIDDLLSLARINRVEMNRAVVDLAQMVREVVEELRRAEPGRAVELQVAGTPTARGDARLLRVALENLVGNAWKFTRRVAAPRIEFGSELRDGVPAFYVRDNGAGFDMAYAAKLFVPFQRLHDATQFEGSGIGLATVQRIIHRHGGRIWGESQPGRGATFWFTVRDR